MPFKDTFLSVTGSIDGEFANAILEFNRENDTWILREEELAAPRQWHSAFLIPDNVICCN